MPIRPAGWGRRAVAAEMANAREGRLVGRPVIEDLRHAALHTLESASRIRVGDARRLACADRSQAKSLATLDQAMAGNASRVTLEGVESNV